MDPGILPLNSISNDPFTDAERAMDLAQERFGIPKILDAYDLVTIPDDLSIMTYLSYFRDYVVNAEKKADEDRAREEEKKRKTADVVQVYAKGSGIEAEGLYANLPATFTIQACNFFGEELKSGGEHFEVNVTGTDGEPISTEVTDRGDGEYDATYLPPLPDNYEVQVLLGGRHIKGINFASIPPR
jgi:filamin